MQQQESLNRHVQLSTLVCNLLASLLMQDKRYSFNIPQNVRVQFPACNFLFDAGF